MKTQTQTQKQKPKPKSILLTAVITSNRRSDQVPRSDTFVVEVKASAEGHKMDVAGQFIDKYESMYPDREVIGITFFTGSLVEGIGRIRDARHYTTIHRLYKDRIWFTSNEDFIAGNFTDPPVPQVVIIAANAETLAKLGKDQHFVEVPVSECQSSICISGGPCPADKEGNTRFCSECLKDFEAAQVLPGVGKLHVTR